MNEARVNICSNSVKYMLSWRLGQPGRWPVRWRDQREIALKTRRIGQVLRTGVTVLYEPYL